MNKVAEGNMKSLVFAIVIFSFVLILLTTFLTNFMSEYNYDKPTEFDALNDISDDYTSLTGDLEADTNTSKTWIQQVTDQIQDTWFGKAITSVKTVWDSRTLLKDYVSVLGKLLGLDSTDVSFVIGFITTLVVMTTLFAFLYFVRSGK